MTSESNNKNNNNNHPLGHFEIPADNTNTLKNFYSNLFRWQFKEHEQIKDYWMITNAGISGGIMKKENPRQITTMFVEVESIDNYMQKAQELDAKVIKNKQEITNGFYAVMEDPQGNTFGIWQNK
jgi:predicted enzyme related to lactoylglutathione lyase